MRRYSSILSRTFNIYPSIYQAMLLQSMTETIWYVCDGFLMDFSGFCCCKTNADVLITVKENIRYIQYGRENKWLGHVLCHEVLLKDTIKRRMRSKVTRSRKTGHAQWLQDDSRIRGGQDSCKRSGSVEYRDEESQRPKKHVTMLKSDQCYTVFLHKSSIKTAS